MRRVVPGRSTPGPGASPAEQCLRGSYMARACYGWVGEGDLDERLKNQLSLSTTVNKALDPGDWGEVLD